MDIDAACQIISEFQKPAFAVIKHTNVCGIAERNNVTEAWEAALAGDPESAFGGVLITNQNINADVAQKINELFFEILIAPGYDEAALATLKGKKNRILLQQKRAFYPVKEYKRILNGVLVQDADTQNFAEWKEASARTSTTAEKENLFSEYCVQAFKVERDSAGKRQATDRQGLRTNQPHRLPAPVDRKVETIRVHTERCGDRRRIRCSRLMIVCV